MEQTMEQMSAGSTREARTGERRLHRIAGGLAVVGTVLSVPLQATLARVSGPDIASYFTLVLGRPYQEQYLILTIVMLVFAMGMAAIAATLRTGPAAGLATLAIPVIAVGGAISGFTLIVFAIALPQVVAAWDAAGRDATTFAAASGVWWIGRAGFIAFLLMLFGAGVATLGLAVAGSGRHPSWLGWLGAAIGLAAMVSAVILGVQGPGAVFERTVFPVVPMAATLWVLAMGVLTWRQAARADSEA